MRDEKEARKKGGKGLGDTTEGVGKKGMRNPEGHHHIFSGESF